MTNPLITCGVTAFNAEDTVARAIHSALAQNYRPIEIVIVDDCSTDSTPEILAALAAQHPDLRVFRQAANGGVAATRNRIIGEARGEFIAFFDDDDESLPERLGRQLDRIVDHERDFAKGAAVICHTARRIRHPNGHAETWRALGEHKDASAPHGAALAGAILGVGLLPDGRQSGSAATCSQMARRAAYEALGKFDASFRRVEDCDFAVRAALAGAHFVGLAEPLVAQTLTATSEKRLTDQRFYSLKLLEKYRDFPTQKGNRQFARHYYEARFAFMARRYHAFLRHILAAAMMRPGLALRHLLRACDTISLTRRMGRFYVAADEQSRS